jgi:hypothetical protein
MKGEFHIFASAADSCFTVKEIDAEPGRVFSSLFEAARHARTESKSEEGFVVIHDDTAKAVNRIPFHITPSAEARFGP